MTCVRATVLEWSSVLAEPGGDADWFDAERYLGKRGHKYQTRGTKLWLAACSQLATMDVRGEAVRTGIAVGTNFGAHRTLRELETVITQEGAAALSPTYAPNFCINLIASHAGIKYEARRFSLTITTPGTAGLDTFAAASRELSKGRCDLVVAGGAEEVEQDLDPSGAHVEGAIAATLAREASTGLAILAGFAELWIPYALWERSPQSVGGLLGTAIQRCGMEERAAACREAVIVGDDPELFPRMDRALSGAGLDIRETGHVAIAETHGSIEPLCALRSCMGRGHPVLFVYAGSAGPVRLVAVE